MKLLIEHETTFTYTKPVREAVGETRLRPRDDAGQRLLNFRLSLDPSTPFERIADRFGNALHCYTLLQPHRRMTIISTSTVETSADPLVTAPPLTPLQLHEYSTASSYVPLVNDLRDFAQAAAPEDGDGAAVARALMSAIYSSCIYEPGSTDISTTAEAVLLGRRGVCQDFAHLMIGLCRCLGMPARYVSGYFYDPAKPADAILASHAWAEVFIEGHGWLGLDPTHNRETGARYTRVAIGRDYADAAPIRGMFQGDADESLQVRVQIRASGE